VSEEEEDNLELV